MFAMNCPRCGAELLWLPCQRCGARWAAIISPTDIPGLFDILIETGEELRDLGMNQVASVIRDRGLYPAVAPLFVARPI